MVAKNRMVGLTEPAIGHHGGDLDHSNVRYRTIEANERPFLPVSIFAISSSQPIGLVSERLADHAQPGDLRARGMSVLDCQAWSCGPSHAVAGWNPSTMWSRRWCPDRAHSETAGSCALEHPDSLAEGKWPLRRLDHQRSRRKISENSMCHTTSPASFSISTAWSRGSWPWAANTSMRPWAARKVWLRAVSTSGKSSPNAS
jgi:hypothetical protein